jgi:hypothetical protein
MLTERQVIEIAKTEFEKHGRSASTYGVTVEPYHANETQWIVWFDKLGPFPIPGGKEAVLVNKVTGETTFMPGE